MDDREPSITLAWLFILVFLPVIGVFFYIFFGRDWKVVAQRKGWIQTLRRVETEEMAPIYERNAGATERFAREWAGTIAVPVSRAPSPARTSSTVLPAASVELFVTGKEKFARLKQDLAGAQRFIHLQYFIWEQDELTAEIGPSCSSASRPGVEVRIMYDWMGCITFKKDELKQLARRRRHRARRRHRPAAHQLPQPPQDRRHRRRDRLHRRHERRPGVHRRRQAVRHLARHASAPHRPGRGRAGEAVRVPLVRAQEGPRGPLRSAVHAGARP